mmetsp:Transcript_24657/g.33314  ORF Transcript_24657/g.33314 Transcript_24657/m.33314 type:complete len:82 (+) Transcript_24657:94-339(+)
MRQRGGVPHLWWHGVLMHVKQVQRLDDAKVQRPEELMLRDVAWLQDQERMYVGWDLVCQEAEAAGMSMAKLGERSPRAGCP